MKVSENLKREFLLQTLLLVFFSLFENLLQCQTIILEGKGCPCYNAAYIESVTLLYICLKMDYYNFEHSSVASWHKMYDEDSDAPPLPSEIYMKKEMTHPYKIVKMGNVRD